MLGDKAAIAQDKAALQQNRSWTGDNGRARSRKVADFSDKIMLKAKDFRALSDST
jgi:hypothetical protein